MLRSLRNFIVSLLISGLVFGTAAYFLSGILIECLGPLFGINAENHLTINNNDKEKEEEENPNETIVATESSFSMLLITTNYKPSKSGEYLSTDVSRYPKNESGTAFDSGTANGKKIEATDFVIFRGNSRKNEFTLTYLPSILQVNIKGRTLTLSEAYREFGVSTLIKKITAITGFEFDSYSIFDVEDISYIVDYVGGISYNVPTDIKDGDNVILSNGTKNIKGNEAIKLLDYQGYSSVTQRGQMLSSLSKALMSKISNKIYKVDILALHRSSQSKVDTTLTSANVNNILNLLYSYGTANISEISYPGNLKKTNDETVFIPNIATAVSNFSKYR